MGPCVMLGDSIAVGVGQFRPDCVTIARVGITSGRYIATMLPSAPQRIESAVISLGVNDDDTVDTLENLRQVRARVGAAAVIWLLPGKKPDVRSMIAEIAREYGDRTIDTLPQVGRDHLHPTRAGYRLLAAETDGAGGEEQVAEAPDPAPREPAGDVGTAFSRHGEHAKRHGRLSRLSTHATPAQRSRALRASHQRDTAERSGRRPTHAAERSAHAARAEPSRLADHARTLRTSSRCTAHCSSHRNARS